MIQHAFTASRKALTAERFQLENRLYQGCPTIACTKGGKIYAGWYSGGSKEPSLLNYNLLTVSGDGGKNWRELFVLEGCPDQKIQALDIEIFIDPLARLWVCWVQRNWALPRNAPGHLNQWAMICADPDSEEPEFSAPFFLGEGFMRCAPEFLADGRWLFPAYNWMTDNYAFFETADQGEHFSPCSGPKKISTDFDEAMFLETADHEKVMMLARTTCGALAYTESADSGRRWSEPVLRRDLPDPGSRFFWKRLPSGRILMVKNLSPEKRVMMSAMLSEDEGKTWPFVLTLDARETSYPEAALAFDGSIFIVYDRGRCSHKEILLSRITEQEILQGKISDPASFLNRIISKAPEIPALGRWYREAVTLYANQLISLPLI